MKKWTVVLICLLLTLVCAVAAVKMKIDGKIFRDNGKACNVAGIAAEACREMEKLTSITVGKNVETIARSVFISCKNPRDNHPPDRETDSERHRRRVQHRLCENYGQMPEGQAGRLQYIALQNTLIPFSYIQEFASFFPG